MKLLISIAILIYLPLLESIYSSTLWGLHWQSPLLMDRVSSYLLFIKTLSVVFGLYLIIKNTNQLKTLIPSKLLYFSQLTINCLVGAIQLLLLTLGILFVGFDGDLKIKHREQSFDNGTLYVLTADPGAMGKAYHYFYLKCSKPFNRYDLTLIKKTDWLGNFEFKKFNDSLVIETTEGEVITLNLSENKRCT